MEGVEGGINCVRDWNSIKESGFGKFTENEKINDF